MTNPRTYTKAEVAALDRALAIELALPLDVAPRVRAHIAALVEAEREACAQIADAHCRGLLDPGHLDDDDMIYTDDVAKLIRARGPTPHMDAMLAAERKKGRKDGMRKATEIAREHERVAREVVKRNPNNSEAIGGAYAANEIEAAISRAAAEHSPGGECAHCGLTRGPCNGRCLRSAAADGVTQRNDTTT